MQERVYLREWRQTKGMTQPELAARIGTVKSEISRLENGSRRLTTEWMSRIAGALGISLTDLFKAPVLDFSKVPINHNAYKTKAQKCRTELSPSPEGRWFSLVEVAEADLTTALPGDLCVASRHTRGITSEGLYLVQLKSTIGLRRATLVSADICVGDLEHVSGTVYDPKGEKAVGKVLGEFYAI